MRCGLQERSSRSNAFLLQPSPRRKRGSVLTGAMRMQASIWVPRHKIHARTNSLQVIGKKTLVKSRRKLETARRKGYGQKGTVRRHVGSAMQVDKRLWLTVWLTPCSHLSAGRML